MSSVARDQEIVDLTAELVFNGELAVEAALELNALRFTTDEINAATWLRFVATATRFFHAVTGDAWPVQLVRLSSPSVREHLKTNSVDFRNVFEALTRSLETEDPRVAYWASERKELQSLRFVLPPDGIADLDKLRKAIKAWLPTWTRPVAEVIAEVPSFKEMSVKTEKIEDTVSAPGADTRQEEQTPIEEASAFNVGSETAQPLNGARRTMGQTFNLNDTASAKRTLYQYWVWNEDTDEVLDHASVIVEGDTSQEATLNLKALLKQRLAEKSIIGNVRFHVNEIDSFVKTPAEKRVSVDAMLNTLRDALVAGEE